MVHQAGSGGLLPLLPAGVLQHALAGAGGLLALYGWKAVAVLAGAAIVAHVVYYLKHGKWIELD